MQRETLFLFGALGGMTVSLLVIWPFLDAIAWAVFTAYFLRHVAEHLTQHIDNDRIATAVPLLLLTAVIGGTVYFIVSAIPVAAIVTQQVFSAVTGGVDVFAEELGLAPDTVDALNEVLIMILVYIENAIHGVIFNVSDVLMHLGLYFIVTVYLVKDGARMSNAIFTVINQFPAEYRSPANAVAYSIDHLFRGVFTAYLLVDVVMGVLAVIGYYLLGIEHYLVWGVLTGILGFLPIISSAMVYVPLSVAYYLQGNVVTATAIMVYGIVVLNMFTEIVLRPYFGAYKTQENPFLLLLGFIIGPFTLGLKGLIIGPILLVVTKNLYTMQYFDTPAAQNSGHGTA